MSLVKRLAFAACFVLLASICTASGAASSSSQRSGKSFGLKSLFGFGDSTTTARPAPKQIWKIHKYHGIELRPVLSPPTPAKEYGPPAETYGPIATKEEPSKGFTLPLKLKKFNIFKQKAPETVTARQEVYGPPILPYSPPLEAYRPPSTAYGTPVTSYGTPAESYETPSGTFNPPADAYNKLPAFYPAAVETVTRPPPTEKYLKSIKTIQFPFKKFPKISSETKEPEPQEVYSPDGTSSSDLQGLDDLDALAKLSSFLPEGADSKTTDAVSKLLEHVDVETISNVLEFLNSKNHGNEPIDISSLISLAEYIPSLEKTQQHFDLGSLIKSIPDLSGHGKGHFAKLLPFSKRGHPKLITVLTVLKGLKAAEIAALSHILGLGKKHHSIFGKLSAVGTTIAAVKAGKAATLGVLGASFAGVKGAIQKPFKHIGSKLFPGKDHKKIKIPSLLPVAVSSISSFGDKFKHIPENLLSKLGSHSVGPYPASGVPDLPSLPDFGLHLPKFPKISISGGYKLEKNSGAPYVRISYPKKSVDTAPYPDALSILPATDAESYSVPIIPTTYSHANPDPRNQPSSSLSTSASVNTNVGSSASQSSFEAPSPVYVPPKEEYEAPKPIYVAPQETYELPSPTYTAPQETYEAPNPTYTAPQATYEAPKPTYTAPQATYEAPKPTYTAPQETYEAPQPTYTAPQEIYEAPKPTYNAPQETYEAPKPTYVTQESYEAPKTTYTAPEPTYSAPKLPYEPKITYSPQTPQYIRHTIKLNPWTPETTYSAPAAQYETPESVYQAPQTVQQSSHIRKSSFNNRQQAYAAPQHAYQHHEAPQQAYLVPQASQEYQQVVKAPSKVSENYRPLKSSKLPTTAFQARHTYEDYEDDFVYETESRKESQRSPLNTEETEEERFETYHAPTEIESQEDTYEQPGYDTKLFVDGQYLPRNKYSAKSAAEIEAESKRWPNTDEEYYPGTQVSYPQIPQSPRYFSNENTFGVYQDEENEEAASESKARVVSAPAPLQDDAKTSSSSAETSPTESKGEESKETKKVATGGNNRSEKQLKSSDFVAPAAAGGFHPSTGSATTGSSYSRVSYQRSSPIANKDKTADLPEITVSKSGAASLPVTVAESLIKPMPGPREMKVDALAASQSSSTVDETKL